MVIAGVLLAAACGRRGGLGDLRPFPGATEVGTSTFVAESLYGFPRASWQQMELRTHAPYAEVRDFYKQLSLRSQSSAFESEVPKSDGRLYYRIAADAGRKTFYVVTVEERRRARDVSIVLRRGVAK